MPAPDDVGACPDPVRWYRTATGPTLAFIAQLTLDTTDSEPSSTDPYRLRTTRSPS